MKVLSTGRGLLRVFYNIVKHPLHICISCSPQIEEIASSVCFYLKVTHGTTALRGHGLGYWPGNADYFLDNILEKMIIVSFDKCMCARIPLPAMKVKISRRGGRAVQRARAGNITANTNKHFSNQNQIKWQNALNLNPVRLNITIAARSCSVWTLYNAMTRPVPSAAPCSA